MSDRKNNFNYELEEAIKVLFIRNGYNSKKAHEAAFHLVDWCQDLHDLNNLYKNYKKFSREKSFEIINQFLIHAAPHIIAAHELAGWGKPKDTFSKKDRRHKKSIKMN